MLGGGQGVVIQCGPSPTRSGSLIRHRQKRVRDTSQAGLQSVIERGQGFASEPILVADCSDTGQPWSQELDKRAVVRVERGRSEEIGDSGEVASVEHDKAPGRGKKRVRAPVG